MEQKYSKEALVQAGLDITKILTEMAAVDNAGHSFLRDYLNNLQSDSGVYKKQSDALQHLSDTSMRIGDTTQNILGVIEDNSARIDDISIQFDKLNIKMEEIKTQRKEMELQMKELYEFIQRIQGFVQNIQNISEHTNLLSFNASIEAAHAGKAGAGFRIIAHEVKKLSEQTKVTSTDITRIIDDLNHKVETVISTNAQYDDFLNEIKKLTSASGRDFEVIKRNSADNTHAMKSMYEEMKNNQENIVLSLQEVEQSNIAQIKKIAQSETETSVTMNDTMNDRLSFLHELSKLFQYMKTHQIE